VRSSDTASAVTRQIQLASASAAPRRGSEYAELSRQIKDAGLLERRPGYYIWKIAVTIGLLAAGWTAFVLLGNSWWQIAVAAFLAVIFSQIGFLGHDAGHRQVFGTRRANYVAGVLLLLEGVNLHVASIQALTRRASRHRLWEWALITIHAVGYLAVVFLVLSPVKAVVFMIVQQGPFGLYLGCSFAPNHKGMPILDVDDQSDFLRGQAVTSRNVRGGWLTDAALGGLNY
jgi:fatty acid desaturase